VSRDFFASGFFHESVSPKPLIIALGTFQIFSKTHGDIHSSRFATGDTGGKWKKSSIRKFVIISVPLTLALLNLPKRKV
jgi:hypothetical protein